MTKEEKWVAKYLNHRTDGWEYLVTHDYTQLDELEHDSELRLMLEAFIASHAAVRQRLGNLKYEAG